MNLNLTEGLLGGIAIHQTGSPLPETTRQLALEADATLMGAVGLPEGTDMIIVRELTGGIYYARRAASRGPAATSARSIR